MNDFDNVVDWLNDIISDPEGYKDCYSDSEQARLAEKALEIIGRSQADLKATLESKGGDNNGDRSKDQFNEQD